MRYLLIIAVVMILTAIPAFAQESACEIDLSEVETLLLEAQVAVVAGDTSGALDRIAEMQAALDVIASDCTAGEIALEETFEAPDGSFTLNYPEGWVEDTEAFADGIIFLGSSPEALDAATNAEPEPVITSGQQIIGVLTGDADILLSTVEEDAELEEILVAIAGDLKEQYPATSDISYFSVNDRRAGQFEFRGDSFEALILIIEIRAGESYVGLVGVAAPDELDALLPLINRVAESVRVER